MSFERSVFALVLLGWLVLGTNSQANARGLQAKNSGGYFVKIRARGQHRVKMYIHENGRGRPMIMLHGFGASGYEWRKLAPSLARHHRVITMDLKGFGRTSKPKDNRYSIADQAALVIAFIRRANLHNITLVGHSYGGSVALKVVLDFNRTNRNRISRLILMNVPAYPQKMTSFIQQLKTSGLAVMAMRALPAEIVAKLGLHTKKHGLSHVTSSDISAYAQPLRSKGAIDAIIQASRQIVPRNLRKLIARYPTIEQPTLLISCHGDPTVPVSSLVRLNRALPRSKLRMIKRCEHSPPEETPRATLRLIKRFLRQS